MPDEGLVGFGAYQLCAFVRRRRFQRFHKTFQQPKSHSKAMEARDLRESAGAAALLTALLITALKGSLKLKRQQRSSR